MTPTLFYLLILANCFLGNLKNHDLVFADKIAVSGGAHHLQVDDLKAPTLGRPVWKEAFMSDTLCIRIDDAEVELGQSFCLDLKVENFINIVALSWTITYDTTTLAFDTLTNVVFSNVNESTFYEVFTTPSSPNEPSDNGFITMIWTSPGLQPINYPDGTSIYQACFTAITAGGASVEITEDRMPIDAIDSFEQVVPVCLESGNLILQPFSCRQSDSLALVALYNSTNGPGWINTWNLNQPMDSWYGVSLDAEGCVSAIELSNNQLAGGLPAELGALTKLLNLDLNNNQLDGGLPSELANLTNLQRLLLYSNQFSGNIPSNLGNLSNLEDLFLENNQFEGEIPTALSNLTNLRVLSLSSNQLSGSIPAELGSLTNLKTLFIGTNQLTGDIPPELGNLVNLEALDIGNHLSEGNIPSELGNLTKLKNLSLYNSRRTGNIPPELWNLTDLEFLALGANQLAGELSPELGNLTNLRALSLFNNQLTSSIPAELGNLLNLGTLLLSANQFTGSLPPELSNLVNLSSISLHENQLSGCFPESYSIFCGVSYNFNSNPGLPGGGDFAAFCSSGFTFGTSITAPVDARICENETYDFNGRSLSEAGQYRDTLQTVHGCDSILILSLSVDAVSETPLSQSICQGEDYNFGGQFLSAAGEYRDTLTAVNGCDSILILHLVVGEVKETLLSQSICQGESYNFAGQPLSAAGEYRRTLQATSGCDSVLILNLAVGEVKETLLNEVICQGDSFDFDGQSLDSDGNYRQTLTAANGCDSILILSLTVHEAEAAEAGSDLTICNSNTTLKASPPQQAGVSGRWSTNNSSAIILDPNDPETQVADLEPGPHTFTWTLSYDQCPNYNSSDETLVFYESQGINLTPDTFLNRRTGNLLDNDEFPQPIRIEIEEPPEGLNVMSDGNFSYDSDIFLPAVPFSYTLHFDACPELAASAGAILYFLDGKGEAPQVVTPNGDGHNDEFFAPELVKEPEKYPKSELTVFNRWGQVVYKSAPYNNDWDGTYMTSGRPLPADTYYYVLRLSLGEGAIRYGEVTLIR